MNLYTRIISGLTFFAIANTAMADRIWEHTVYDGRDPFTLPQTRIDWVSSSIPGIRAPRVQCKYMHSKVIVFVEGPTISGVQEKVKACGDQAIRDGILVGVPAAIASGGSAGFQAFLSGAGASFNSCVNKISNDFKINYDNPTGWSDWQGC